MACHHGPRAPPRELAQSQSTSRRLFITFHSICKYYLDISNYYLYLLHGVKEPGFKNIGPHLLSIKKSSLKILRIYNYCKYKILRITASTSSGFYKSFWRENLGTWKSPSVKLQTNNKHLPRPHICRGVTRTFFQRKAQFRIFEPCPPKSQISA